MTQYRILSNTFYLGLPGSTWVYLGSSRVYPGLPGSTWVYLGLTGSTWVYLGLLGSTWVYLGLLGSTWVYLGLFEITIEWFRTLRPISGWMGWDGWDGRLSPSASLLRAPTVLITLIQVFSKFLGYI